MENTSDQVKRSGINFEDIELGNDFFYRKPIQ